jgi:genome maintenance exonuclease 1
MVFGKFKESINKISKVHLLEHTLYSHKLKLAGTVDCVGYYNGVLSVIDFKTSKKEKPIEWIENYFVQTCIYAMCIYEMYEIWISQIVLLFACSDLTTPIVVKQIDRELIELTKKYYYHYKNNHAK